MKHRALVVLVALAALLPASSFAHAADCPPRVLVLGAMPLEIHPFLAAGSFDPADTVRVGTRTFFVGELAGHDVALAMTGIGMANAEQTVATAAAEFECGLSAVVFSGVAGSQHSIGEVTVPARWTLDGGTTWLATDARLLDHARAVAGAVELSRVVPIGDDACLCPGVDTIDTPIDLGFDPAIWVGGDGTSGDTLDGLAMPCVPGGGDVFGCQACLEPGATATDIANFAANPPTIEFFQNFFQPPASTTDTHDAQDMESAAAAAAADAAGIPFVAIRGVSDGTRDPLNLPGFPFQFFAYRHLAANNAATVTLAILEVWIPAVAPTPDDVGAGGEAENETELPATGGGATAPALLVLAARAAAVRRRNSMVFGSKPNGRRPRRHRREHR